MASELIKAQQVRDILGLGNRSPLRRFIEAGDLHIAGTREGLGYLFDRKEVEALRDRRGRVKTNRRLVKLGDELFKFDSFNDWRSNARRRFRNRNLTAHKTICIDERGRVCVDGSAFMRARDEKAYPVRVYSTIVC